MCKSFLSCWNAINELGFPSAATSLLNVLKPSLNITINEAEKRFNSRSKRERNVAARSTCSSSAAVGGRIAIYHHPEGHELGRETDETKRPTRLMRGCGAHVLVIYTCTVIRQVLSWSLLPRCFHRRFPLVVSLVLMPEQSAR